MRRPPPASTRTDPLFPTPTLVGSPPGLLAGTVALLFATAIGHGLSLGTTGRVPAMPLVTAAVVAVFGGLTLWLNDETFLKMKPTIVQALFAVVLLARLAFGRVLLKPPSHTVGAIADAGWPPMAPRLVPLFPGLGAEKRREGTGSGSE